MLAASWVAAAALWASASGAHGIRAADDGGEPTDWEGSMEKLGASPGYDEIAGAFKAFQKPLSGKTVYEANRVVAQKHLVDGAAQASKLATRKSRKKPKKKDVQWIPYTLIEDFEAVALTGYSTQDYMLLNPILRGSSSVEVPGCKNKDCTITKEAVMPYIDVAQVALSKLPRFRGKALWRGTNLPQSVEVTVGGQFSDPAFLSTSRDSSVASRDISGKPPSLMFKIVCPEAMDEEEGVDEEEEEEDDGLCSFLGRDIAAFTSHPDEKEVLFPPGTVFNVMQQKTFNTGRKNFAGKWVKFPLYYLVQA